MFVGRESGTHDSLTSEEAMQPHKEPEQVRVCPRHRERTTPLIWTFAFPYCEYWCPWCGYKHGMLGAGPQVDCTMELAARQLTDEIYARDFLRAVGSRSCSQLLYQGEWIRPEELPESEKERYAATIRNYVYPYFRGNNATSKS